MKGGKRITGGVIPSNYLVCPNCRGKLSLSSDNSRYSCTLCTTDFPIENGVIKLLPTNLLKTQVNEDTLWRTHEIEGVDKPPWLALLHKHRDIRHFLDKIQPMFEFNGRILDLGAGSCWASGLIKLEYPDTEVIATDVSQSALYKGMEVVKLLNSSIDYYATCDAEQLPFSSDFFDFVFSSAMIHHLPNPKGGISEIFRVLKRGGTYLGTGELAANKVVGNIWKKIGSSGDREKKHGIQENSYSYNTWKEFFRSTGFENIHIDFEKDWTYKQYHWFVSLYYKCLSFIPDSLVKHLFASSIRIIGTKAS